jgi:hypothetical protein
MKTALQDTIFFRISVYSYVDILMGYDFQQGDLCCPCQ